MIILPAIDIIDGKPVRLYQGDYDKKEVVADSVGSAAASFQRQGAEYVHMVDLDGARAGYPVNRDLILKTAASLDIPVEVGGGIRSFEDIQSYLENGVSRVILGTSALEDPQLLDQALTAYKEKIAVGVDCKNGYVCTAGWQQTSTSDYISFILKMEQMGVQTIIFTDISKDGTLEGPNLEMLENIRKNCGVNIIASGGIKNIDHIASLAALNVYGCITGKAMYTGSLDLKEAIEKGRSVC